MNSRQGQTAAPFELCSQIELGGKGAFLGRLSLGGLHRLIIELAKLSRTCHEQARLFSIWIQAVFKSPHSSTYSKLDYESQPFCTACGRAAIHSQVAHTGASCRLSGRATAHSESACFTSVQLSARLPSIPWRCGYLASRATPEVR